MAPQGQESILVGRSHGGREQKAEWSHLQLQQESENKLEVHAFGGSYKLSKPAARDALPAAKLHLLKVL